MAFTMHSHSGQFCPGHAKDQLEDIIKVAIAKGFTTMGLTEHMPRTSLDDLYPEELDDPEGNLAILMPRHEAYLKEAQRLQTKYASQIHILIGFEGEWIRSDYGPLITTLSAHPSVDYFMGSLHHVNGHPLDFDGVFYRRCVESAGGTEEKMFERYYDQQYEMLTTLKPRIVGHFDLPRLLSTESTGDVREWKGVWARIVRNLEFVRGYGGWLECNTSALRKALPEPYPCRAIAEEWLRIGGKFTLSDDSHGIEQLGTNYMRGLAYLESLGVSEVWTLQRKPHPWVEGQSKGALDEKSVAIVDIKSVCRAWTIGTKVEQEVEDKAVESKKDQVEKAND
ncbi:putative Histidinol phosphate phosphatase HisJ family protein [Seiridium cardinale]|uniref:Histidinol-phosphatase n=1 Tax=Seiridium cardinale TaxID=138064 RepID=A0ABR2XSN9_9PEZI